MVLHILKFGEVGGLSPDGPFRKSILVLFPVKMRCNIQQNIKAALVLLNTLTAFI